MLIALRILAGLTLGVVIIVGLLYYATVVNLAEHLVDADTYIVPLRGCLKRRKLACGH